MTCVYAISQAHDEKLIALKESAWHGRSGGFDISESNADAEPPSSLLLLRDSVKLRKKNIQRGELPPLGENNNSSLVSSVDGQVCALRLTCFLQNDNHSPSRGHSAPDLHGGGGGGVGMYDVAFPGNPEGIILPAAAAAAASAKAKMKKVKKPSETEKRLMNRCVCRRTILLLLINLHLFVQSFFAAGDPQLSSTPHTGTDPQGK